MSNRVFSKVFVLKKKNSKCFFNDCQVKLITLLHCQETRLNLIETVIAVLKRAAFDKAFQMNAVTVD